MELQAKATVNAFRKAEIEAEKGGFYIVEMGRYDGYDDIRINKSTLEDSGNESSFFQKGNGD